jgi:hypothetical protein
MITAQERKQKALSLTEDFWDLYNSSTFGKKLIKLDIKYNFINFDLFTDLIGDTILGFYKTSELPELLQKEVGVSADDAQKIISDLSEFLTPIYEREKNEIPVKQQELTDLQQSLEDTAIPSLSESDEATNNVKTSTVQPMRTMEADMNRIHGYGAYRAAFPDEGQEMEHKEETIRSATQDDILTKKPILTDMPSYDEDESV